MMPRIKFMVMSLVNWLLRKFKITNKDYYYAEKTNPNAIMLGCEQCDEYDNNGCGTYVFCQYDCSNNKCDMRDFDG